MCVHRAVNTLLVCTKLTYDLTVALLEKVKFEHMEKLQKIKN